MSRLSLLDPDNLVGGVPEGWWRDRQGAARRLEGVEQVL